ncbi:hypothetical protein NW837_04090, partial [Synechococcus sp. R6-10]|uniref:hypothetical protein n=1 Tax=Synechococcus sp. R6-10 TaxID=2291956 RepID=UPI0039C0EE2A
CCPYRPIDQVVQLGGVPAVLLFGGVENLVASVRKALQSAVNLLTQLYRDYQLATYRDSLAHGLIVVYPDF